MNIQFKAVNLKIFLMIVVSLMIIGTIIGSYLTVNIHEKLDIIGVISDRGNFRPVEFFVGTVIGISAYFIMIMLVRHLFTINYKMMINDFIQIENEKTIDVIQYNEIIEMTVWNNTDYAKIIIETNKRKYKYYVGFANFKLSTILNNKMECTIFESFSELDKIFAKNKFKKISENKKGINKIRVLTRTGDYF